MKTKTTVWLFGFFNLVIVFVMIFGLLGTTPLRTVQASLEQASQVLNTAPVDFDPAGMPSGDVQHHPYTLPDSARFERPEPAADRALVTTYRPDRLPTALEDAEQPAFAAFVHPTAPTGITADVDYAFAVDPFYDVVWSWGFPAYEDITLTVGTDTYVRSSDEYGKFDWTDLGHDFIVGETITLTSGAFTKSHKVQKLTLNDLDQTLDIVKGTAKAGAVVDVWAVDSDSETGFQVTANTEGVFKAKMALAGIDLAPGTYGNIGRWESDGDGTIINWQILNPHIRVYPDNQNILGFNWWPATQVNLSIDGVFYGSALSDPWGFVEFRDITESLAIGRVVVMTDGKTTRTHTITPMSFDLIDVDNNRVEGTGVPGLVSTYAWSPGYDEEWVDTIADASGKWAAEYVMDIGPGSEIGARQFDSEGNRSVYYWYLPNPAFEVKPEEDSVWGWEWPPLTEIKLSVNGDEYYRTSMENGDVDFSGLDRDIVTGDVVEMTAGTVTKTHIVHYLTVDEVDADLDTITGFTETSKHLETWVCTNGECWGMEVESTMDTGSWAADYSEQTDIVPGTEGGVRFWEDDNTATMVYWRVPDPWIAVNVNQNYVFCSQFASNTPVTLFIDAVEIATIDLDYWGNGQFDGIETHPGQEVTVTGGGFTKSTIVQNITLNGVDQYADTVFGTADPGSELEVWAWEDYWGLEGGALYTTADSTGNWVVDFSTNWDIVPGWRGYAQIHELEDTDYTEVFWEIPIPWFEINIVEDAIWGGNWTPGSEVTVTADTYTNTLTADENGNVGFGFMDFDLAPGDYVEMTDGITTKELTAANLGFSGYDLDLDTLSGTADPGTWAHAVICSEGGCNDIYDNEIGVDGETLFDFSGIVDIQPGTEGWFDKWDEDGDNTVVTWRVPDPRFSVNSINDAVYGNRWSSFANLTLKVNSDIFTATADFWGNASFEGLSIDIIPGDLIEMTDGVRTKMHTVPLLEVTDIDWEEDIVSGIANPLTDVVVNTNRADGTGNEILFDASDSAGNWEVDFTGLVDIIHGSEGWAAIEDDDDDGTWVDWRVPAPRFGVNLNWNYIWGDQWEAGSPITVNVRGTDVTTETVPVDGVIGIDISGYNVQPGDIVTVRDSQTTKSILVRNLAITKVDPLSDTVSGMADPGSEIATWAEKGDGLGHSVSTVTDATGKWVADYAGIGVDLVLGDYGFANIVEDDGDYTEVRWDVYAPLYPAYEEKLVTSKVTFDWDDVPDATNYKIQLSTKKDFSVLLVSTSTVDSTYAYATKLTNNTVYYWRVKAKVGGVWGSWLPVWKFTSMDPLARPTLVYPGPKLIITDDNTPTLDWDPVTNGVNYLVQISKVVDFSTTYFKATVSNDTQFETNPLPNGKYFWRVRALDASGGKGPWSEIRMFKIAVP